MKAKGILLAIAIFISLLGCQPKGSKSLPDELVGVWKTSAPKYEDCSFQLTKGLIVFVNENLLQRSNVNVISRVEKIHTEKRCFYIIYYENEEGQEYKLPFFYDPVEGGAIRFKNQEQIEWRKIDMPNNDKAFINSG